MRHSSQTIDFPYTEPVHGDEEESVYYWWWMYLKRAKGPIHPDFGDVGSNDFWAWWSGPAPSDDGRSPARNDREKWRSVYLFANPETWKMARVKEPLPVDAYTDPTVLILTVPLHEPDSYLLERFKAYLDTFKDEGGRGIRAARSSTARYPVVGQPNVNALKKTLAVYDLWLIRKPEEKTLWEIWLELNPYLQADLDRKPESAPAIKMSWAAGVSRYIKKAKAMINNAAAGRFPDVK